MRHAHEKSAAPRSRVLKMVFDQMQRRTLQPSEREENLNELMSLKSEGDTPLFLALSEETPFFFEKLLEINHTFDLQTQRFHLSMLNARKKNLLASCKHTSFYTPLFKAMMVFDYADLETFFLGVKLLEGTTFHSHSVPEVLLAFADHIDINLHDALDKKEYISTYNTFVALYREFQDPSILPLQKWLIYVRMQQAIPQEKQNYELLEHGLRLIKDELCALLHIPPSENVYEYILKLPQHAAILKEALLNGDLMTQHVPQAVRKAYLATVRTFSDDEKITFLEAQGLHITEKERLDLVLSLLQQYKERYFIQQATLLPTLAKDHPLDFEDLWHWIKQCRQASTILSAQDQEGFTVLSRLMEKKDDYNSRMVLEKVLHFVNLLPQDERERILSLKPYPPLAIEVNRSMDPRLPGGDRLKKHDMMYQQNDDQHQTYRSIDLVAMNVQALKNLPTIWTSHHFKSVILEGVIQELPHHSLASQRALMHVSYQGKTPVLLSLDESVDVFKRVLDVHISLNGDVTQVFAQCMKKPQHLKVFLQTLLHMHPDDQAIIFQKAAPWTGIWGEPQIHSRLPCYLELLLMSLAFETRQVELSAQHKNKLRQLCVTLDDLYHEVKKTPLSLDKEAALRLQWIQLIKKDRHLAPSLLRKLLIWAQDFPFDHVVSSELIPEPPLSSEQVLEAACKDTSKISQSVLFKSLKELTNRDILLKKVIGNKTIASVLMEHLLASKIIWESERSIKTGKLDALIMLCSYLEGHERMRALKKLELPSSVHKHLMKLVEDRTTPARVVSMIMQMPDDVLTISFLQEHPAVLPALYAHNPRSFFKKLYALQKPELLTAHDAEGYNVWMRTLQHDASYDVSSLIVFLKANCTDEMKLAMLLQEAHEQSALMLCSASNVFYLIQLIKSMSTEYQEKFFLQQGHFLSQFYEKSPASYLYWLFPLIKTLPSAGKILRDSPGDNLLIHVLKDPEGIKSDAFFKGTTGWRFSFNIKEVVDCIKTFSQDDQIYFLTQNNAQVFQLMVEKLRFEQDLPADFRTIYLPMFKDMLMMMSTFPEVDRQKIILGDNDFLKTCMLLVNDDLIFHTGFQNVLLEIQKLSFEDQAHALRKMTSDTLTSSSVLHVLNNNFPAVAIDYYLIELASTINEFQKKPLKGLSLPDLYNFLHMCQTIKTQENNATLWRELIRDGKVRFAKNPAMMVWMTKFERACLSSATQKTTPATSFDVSDEELEEFYQKQSPVYASVWSVSPQQQIEDAENKYSRSREDLNTFDRKAYLHLQEQGPEETCTYDTISFRFSEIDQSRLKELMYPSGAAPVLNALRKTRFFTQASIVKILKKSGYWYEKSLDALGEKNLEVKRNIGFVLFAEAVWDLREKALRAPKDMPSFFMYQNAYKLYKILLGIQHELDQSSLVSERQKDLERLWEDTLQKARRDLCQQSSSVFASIIARLETSSRQIKIQALTQPVMVKVEDIEDIKGCFLKKLKPLLAKAEQMNPQSQTFQTLKDLSLLIPTLPPDNFFTSYRSALENAKKQLDRSVTWNTSIGGLFGASTKAVILKDVQKLFDESLQDVTPKRPNARRG